MKHADLRAIAHNIADSFACGVGLLIGVYEMNVFREARNSSEGFITVDFLRGTTTGGSASASLLKAISLYRQALPEFCKKHGATNSSFRELTARYSFDGSGRLAIVTIEDENGRRSIDKYVDLPLRRVRTVDNLGRIRTKRA